MHKKNILLVFQIQNEKDFESNYLIDRINQLDKVITQNSYTKDFLIKSGVNPDLIFVSFGGINRNFYYPSQKKENFVLISGDFKSRKNPEGIIKVVKNNSNMNFVIHGKNLSLFKSIKNYPNLNLINWNQSLQSKLMREARVFLSLSKLEGGPMSILEALASGTPVISTDTGFARDIINNNCGSVIPINFSLEEIRLELSKWSRISNNLAPKDFLGGRYSFEEYGHELFD
jgi:glycosyltransferase involved in cell wall biosynthesis